MLEFGSDPQLQRNEYDPHFIKLSIEQFKIFEIKGYQLSSGSLQHGAQTSGWITFVEEITQQNMATLNNKILAVLIPPDSEKL